MDLQVVSHSEHSPIDFAVAAWLGALVSPKTRIAYTDAISRFRFVLQGAKYDLDSDTRAVAILAEQWAMLPQRAGQKSIKAATYNTRIAALSSFYEYVLSHELSATIVRNPLAMVKRQKAQLYAGAKSLSDEDVIARLFAIEHDTPLGVRDFALILVALTTGRRAAEIRDMTIGDLGIVRKRVGARFEDVIQITWPTTKGGRTLVDTLDLAPSVALAGHLVAHYGPMWQKRVNADAPVWTSLSSHNRGNAIGYMAIRDVFEGRLGTTKVHTSRHTFARLMEQLGATVPEISRRLGHANISTTHTYLERLNSAENPHGADLSRLLRLDEMTERTHDDDGDLQQ